MLINNKIPENFCILFYRGKTLLFQTCNTTRKQMSLLLGFKNWIQIWPVSEIQIGNRIPIYMSISGLWQGWITVPKHDYVFPVKNRSVPRLKHKFFHRHVNHCYSRWIFWETIWNQTCYMSVLETCETDMNHDSVTDMCATRVGHVCHLGNDPWILQSLARWEWIFQTRCRSPYKTSNWLSEYLRSSSAYRIFSSV